jgi:hypothetical protein
MRGSRGAAQWSLLCSGKPISQTTHVQFRRGYDSASIATNNLPRSRYSSLRVGDEAELKPFVESLSVSITHVPTTVSDCASLVSTLVLFSPKSCLSLLVATEPFVHKHILLGNRLLFRHAHACLCGHG